MSNSTSHVYQDSPRMPWDVCQEWSRRSHNIPCLCLTPTTDLGWKTWCLNKQMPYQTRSNQTRCLEYKYEARFTPKKDCTCLWGWVDEQNMLSFLLWSIFVLFYISFLLVVDMWSSVEFQMSQHMFNGQIGMSVRRSSVRRSSGRRLGSRLLAMK